MALARIFSREQVKRKTTSEQIFSSNACLQHTGQQNKETKHNSNELRGKGGPTFYSSPMVRRLIFLRELHSSQFHSTVK